MTLAATSQAPGQSETPSVLIVNTLDLGSVTSPTGTLDLTDGAMIVDYDSSSPSEDIHSLLKSGYNSAAWTGLGINSSSAAAVHNDSGNSFKTGLGHNEASAVLGSGGGTFAGESVDGTAVLVRYVYNGDVNLDGGVDVTDLGTFATNWQQSNVEWPEGDFNYDGTVDVTDLGQIATNWQKGVSDPSSQSFQDAWDELTGG